MLENMGLMDETLNAINLTLNLVWLMIGITHLEDIFLEDQYLLNIPFNVVNSQKYFEFCTSIPLFGV